MIRSAVVLFLMLVILGLTGCNHFTYTPRSKRTIHQAKPSILIFSSIADFRLEQDRWPVSLEDLRTKAEKYARSLENFQYSYTHFRIIDSNTMVFTFAHHNADMKVYSLTEKFDLNSLRGKARFHKKNGKYVWKVKMQR